MLFRLEMSIYHFWLADRKHVSLYVMRAKEAEHMHHRLLCAGLVHYESGALP